MIDYPKYKKVLFCTDFSKISDCAFDYAFGIAKRDEAVLYILHVIPPIPQPDILDTYLTKEQLNKIEEDHQEYLKKMFNDKYLNHIKDKTKVKIVTLSGREDDKIIEFVQKGKYRYPRDRHTRKNGNGTCLPWQRRRKGHQAQPDPRLCHTLQRQDRPRLTGDPAFLREDRRRLLLRECHRGRDQSEGIATGCAVTGVDHGGANE